MTRSTTLKTALAVLALAGAPALTGCSSAGEGAVSGAGIGALTGLVFGAFSGNEGDGALIGATVGAVAGGVIGDQNERNARNAQRQHTTVVYRDQEPRQTGWGDRYSEPRSQTVYTETHYHYETRSPSPRVVIRYDTGPRYRHGYRHHRYKSWRYRDPYCR